MLVILMMRAHIRTCESHLEFMHDCKNDDGRRQFKSCPKLGKSNICNMQLFKERDQSEYVKEYIILLPSWSVI